MKRLVITAAALTIPLMSVFAAPEIKTDGFYDDFSTQTEYSSTTETGRGIYWWKSTNGKQTLTRDYTKNRLIAKISQPKGNDGFEPFGVVFGDDNGAASGGTPFTIDISKNGIWSFDMKNIGTVGLAVRVLCTDVNNKMIDCDKGATVFADIWKYQIQAMILPGDSITFKAGTPNDAGGAKNNLCDFTKGVWGDYGVNPHQIRTDCDLKKIKGINITVLNAEKAPAPDYHPLALVDGLLAISNFKVGNVITSGIEKNLISKNTISSKNSIHIVNGILNLQNVANNVKVFNARGAVVKSFKATDNINVSDFTKGLYLLKADNFSSKFLVK
jgi:hypothetical protein